MGLGVVTTLDAPWPVADEAVYHGPAGAYTLDAAPFTEADPVGVLVSLLAGAGAIIGSTPHMLVGNVHHAPAIWPVLIGSTSKARKGTAWAVANAPLQHVDPWFFAGGRKSRMRSGFGSGEALIDEIRDPDDDEEDATNNKQPDRGAPDKRMLVVETEFASVLNRARRESSILSQVLRQGWDGAPIQANSRARKVSATGYHLVGIGHTTVEELRLRMTDTETYSGFANRHLWVCVKRARRLPTEGNVPDKLSKEHGENIRAAIFDIRKVSRVTRTPDAELLWNDIYDELCNDEPGGLLGAVVARDAPQVLRIALIYALLDGLNQVDITHLDAAHALWKYCRASAAYVWHDMTGNTRADQLLAALKRAGPDGLTSTEVNAVFGNNVPKTEITAIRDALLQRELITFEEIATGGRPIQRMRLSSLIRVDSYNGQAPGSAPIPTPTESLL